MVINDDERTSIQDVKQIGAILPRVVEAIEQRASGGSRLLVIRDTREQAPWEFNGLPVTVTVATLKSGDYTLAGGSTFCIERKSGSDFIASITWGRERFERELGRMAGGGAIIVEAGLHDLLYGSFNRRPRGGQRVHPNAMLGTVASFLLRFGVPTFFASSRADAEALAYHLLRHVERQRQERAAAEQDNQGNTTTMDALPM